MDNPLVFTIVVCWAMACLFLAAWWIVAKPVAVRDSMAETVLYYGFLTAMAFPFLYILVVGVILVLTR